MGVSRSGFSEEAISALKKAFSLLFRKERGAPLDARCALLAEKGLLTEEVEELVEFMRRKAAAPSGRQLDLNRH